MAWKRQIIKSFVGTLIKILLRGEAFMTSVRIYSRSRPLPCCGTVKPKLKQLPKSGIFLK
jgi:hypothetical protein